MCIRDRRNGVCRGEIVINLSTVSANEKTRLIIIDSGMEIWVLKATDRADWQEWVDALELCFKNPPTEPTKEDVAAEESANFLSVLQVVQQKLEELKFQSLEYTPLHSPASPPPTSSAARPLSPLSHTQNNSVSRTSSFSSLTNAFAKHKNSSSETIPTHHHEHDLYKKLSHLESIVGKLTKQMPANSKTQKMTRVKSSASSNFSDNEYFDAMDNNLVNSPGAAVIMLNDEESGGFRTRGELRFCFGVLQSFDRQRLCHFKSYGWQKKMPEGFVSSKATVWYPSSCAQETQSKRVRYFFFNATKALR